MPLIVAGPLQVQGPGTEERNKTQTSPVPWELILSLPEALPASLGNVNEPQAPPMKTGRAS